MEDNIRTMEELNNTPVANMTAKELKEYAKYLRDELADVTASLQNTQRTVESSFEKVRVLQEEINRIKTEANAKLSFAQQAISTCYSSIIFANKS